MDVKHIKDSIRAEVKAELKPRKLLRMAFVPQTKGMTNPIKESFQMFVTMIAQIFVSAKLIGRDHPSYTQEVKGFGAIWLMIIDASTNVKFTRETIFQVIVFYGIVGMLIFGVLDLGAFLLHLGMGHAHAAGTTPDPGSLFNETNQQDNGPTWINSMFPYANNNTGATGLPFALQGMLLTYNTALLALGTAFALYQIAHLFVQSAHQGRFGGDKYSQLHAPLRLVIGIGLLVPTTYGFNSAQLIAIEMAKMGSGLASNVWGTFLNSMNAYNGTTPSVQASDVNTIIQKILVDEACEVGTASVRYTGSSAKASGTSPSTWTTTPWNPTSTPTAYVITFDDKPGDGYCGSITIPKQISNQYTLGADNYFEQAFVTPNTGILDTVWKVANDIYHNSAGGTDPSGPQDPSKNPFDTVDCTGTYCLGQTYAAWLGTSATTDSSGNAVAATGLIAQFQTAATNTNTAYQTASANSQSTTNSDWTTAGFMFLNQAHHAADLATAQNPTIDVNLPNPSIMKLIDSGAGPSGNCSGFFSFMNYACDASGKTVVTATQEAVSNLEASVPVSGMDVVSFTPSSNGGSNNGGILSKVLAGPMTTLFNAFQQLTGINVSTQGFGQSIFNVMWLGTIITVISGGFYVAAATMGDTPFSYMIGGICIMIGSALMPIGISLSVMIPLMPAGRFIFGIFTWILTLFEGVIAIPVVALISINFEGDGLFAHGKAGWLFLLQMMLRPVLMVFGLLGGALVFDTLAGFITKSVFYAWFGLLFSGSITGAISSLIGVIGFLYFYVLTLYACANMSFGLINTIPDRILEWAGMPVGGLKSGGEVDSVLRDASNQSSGMMSGAGSRASQGKLDDNKRQVDEATAARDRATADQAAERRNTDLINAINNGRGGGGNNDAANQRQITQSRVDYAKENSDQDGNIDMGKIQDDASKENKVRDQTGDHFP